MSSVPELLTIESAAGANGEWVLFLCGELDLSNASSVLARVIDSDLVAGESLVLDLSGVTFVDSSGLIALLHAEHYLAGRSCHFALRSPTSQVRRVLELAGLADSFLIIEHDEPRSLPAQRSRSLANARRRLAAKPLSWANRRCQRSSTGRLTSSHHRAGLSRIAGGPARASMRPL